MRLYSQLDSHHSAHVIPVVEELTKLINREMRTYMAGIMQMKADEPLYPDANLTLRVAYGKVEGYNPLDGVEYKFYSSLDGVMEKDHPEIYEYAVPQRLKELHSRRDYGVCRPGRVSARLLHRIEPHHRRKFRQSDGQRQGAPDRRQLRPLLGRHHERHHVRPEQSRNICY